MIMQSPGLVCGIPVRNLWLLLLYSSDLLRYLGPRAIAAEESPEDLPDLVATVLSSLVECRLRRNLSRGYLPRRETIHRVRGRVDWLETERKSCLRQGKVVCRFEDHDVDTERNRYVRAALLSIAPIVRDAEVANECRQLASALGRLGVSTSTEPRPRPPKDRLGRHDSVDAQMLAAAQLALELKLPSEMAGPVSLVRLDNEASWIRKLYERAVGGFYKHRLCAPWRVTTGENIHWPVEAPTSGIAAILPKMVTDVVLEHAHERRIVIDTKFNRILAQSQYGGEGLRSGYVYQIYAYVRSREGTGDSMAQTTEGILLHPSVGADVLEEVTIHGHRLRFWTVDLASEPRQIQRRLLDVAFA
jgi:5-methylcytosine-specific restriction enzyme subunit McrC